MGEQADQCPDCNATGVIAPWVHSIPYGPDDDPKVLEIPMSGGPCARCYGTGRLRFIPVRIDILEECYDSVLDLLAHCDGDHPYYDRKYESERKLRDTLKAMLPPRTTP